MQHIMHPTHVRALVLATALFFVLQFFWNGTGAQEATPPTISITPPETPHIIAVKYGMGGYWPFDTDAGDTSGNGNHGVLQQGAAIDASQKKVGGGALLLDGVDDMVSFSAAAVPDNTNTYSVAAWVYHPSDVSNVSTIYSNGAVDNEYWRLGITGDHAIQLRAGSSCVASAVLESGAVPTDQWAHVAMVKNSNDQVTIYVNGIETGTDVFSCNRFGNLNNVGYHRENEEDFFFRGGIDELRMYGRVLSPQEIAALAQQGGTPPAENQPPTANAGADITTNLGSVTQFNGGASSDADGTIVSYAWNFGNGATASGASPTYTYSALGTHTATLTVTDDDGATASDALTVSVIDGTPPSVPSNLSASVSSVSTIDLSWNSATDNIGVTLYRLERCTGIGCTSGFTEIGTPSSTSFMVSGLSAASTYGFRVRAEDGEGNRSGYSSVVYATTHAPNQPPTANAGADITTNFGTITQFNGGASSDADGTIVSYAWDFGNGTTANSANPTHTYGALGTYTATLTVTDDDGATATDSLTVAVTDLAAPSVPGGLSAAALSVSAIGLSWNASTDNVGVMRYRLERCAGSGCTGGFTEIGTPSSPSFTISGLSAASTYGFRVRAEDSAGNRSNYSSAAYATTHTPNQPPTANAGADITTNLGSVTQFNGNASSDSDGAIVSYAWNFGNGATALGASPTHTYSALGTYTATLTVTDDDGATASDTVTVTVVTPPPTPTIKVSGITMSGEVGLWRMRCRVSGTVSVSDNQNQVVSSVTVAGRWSNAYAGAVSGVTSSAGRVTFTSPWVWGGCGKPFILTVDSLARSGYQYAPADNIETSDTLTP